MSIRSCPCHAMPDVLDIRVMHLSGNAPARNLLLTQGQIEGHRADSRDRCRFIVPRACCIPKVTPRVASTQMAQARSVVLTTIQDAAHRVVTSGSAVSGVHDRGNQSDDMSHRRAPSCTYMLAFSAVSTLAASTPEIRALCIAPSINGHCALMQILLGAEGSRKLDGCGVKRCRRSGGTC